MMLELAPDNNRSNQHYHEWLKPGALLYTSFTAALVTYPKKPEE